MKTFLWPALFLFVLFSGCHTSTQAQKPEQYGIKSKKAMKLFLSGLDQLKHRSHRGALQYFQEALSIEPNFGEALYRAGAAHFSLREYPQAKPYLVRAEKHWMPPAIQLFYFLGEVYFAEERFDSAAIYLKRYLSTNPVAPQQFVKTARAHAKACKFAATAMKNPIELDLKPMSGSINTMFPEYLPNLTADENTIFFTSRRTDGTGGFNAELRDYAEDFYFSEFKDGKWQPAKNLGPPVNTDMNEGAASFTPDGQWVYFASCGRKDGFGSCDIYFSRLDGSTWLPPRNLGPAINSKAWDSQPCISNDGNTLYFASSRPGGQGGLDIWYSQKVNGKWTEAKNLGAPINSKGNENSPFLHADDKTFYFASDFHPGFGDMDLFMSKRKGNDWQTPKNLGYPLNTPGDERNIFINTRGSTGYINSDRPGGKGKSDLYYFELDPSIRPEFATYVRGLVRSEASKDPLYSRLTFVNLESKDTIRQVYSNKQSGKFLLSLPVNQEYAAFVEAKGYLFKSQNFSLKGMPEEETSFFDLTIDLESIAVGKGIVLNNIFYESGSFELAEKSQPELKMITRFLKLNPKVVIEISGHTDNVGSNSDNLTLSRNRANSVRDYLLNLGVPEKRIIAKGYGETNPVASNDTDEGRAQNRRTEMIIREK